jgi:tetratricopeptide (TPR) repeat protein/O-antigen ligase
MPPDAPPGRIDRVACAFLAAAAFLVPLVHSTALADPFAFPKTLATVAAALGLLGCALLSRFLEDGRDRMVSPALALAAVVVAAAGAAALRADNRGLALWGFLEIAAGATLFWGVTRFARAAGAVALLLNAVLLAAALVALGALAQVFFPGAGLALPFLSLLPPTRGGATLGEAGAAAPVLLAALPAGIGAAALQPGWRRVACGGLAGLVAAALLFIGRFDGWIVGSILLGATVLGRGLQVLLGDRRPERLVPDFAGDSVRAVLVALIVVIGVVAAARLAAGLPGGRPVEPLPAASFLTPTSGEPRADRAAALPRALRLIGRHPLGVGPDTFRHAFLEVAWTGDDPSPFTLSHQAVHAGNSYLEMTAEIGVAGGLAFALLVLLALAHAGVAAVRAPRPWDAVGFAAFLGLLTIGLAGFLGAPFQQPAPALLLWIGAGLAQVAAARVAPAGLPARLAPALRPVAPRLLRRPFPGAAGAALWGAAAILLAVAAVGRARGLHLATVGQAALRAGGPEAALAAFGRPPARRLPDHLPRVLAANAYLRLGFHERAAEEFGEALRRSPHFIGAYLGRAAARQAMGRYDLAAEDLEAALAIWPENPDTFIALGRLSVARGRLDLAIDHFLKAIRINHQAADPYFLLGQVYLRRGQVDEAIEAYRMCSMKNPRYPGLNVHLGDAFQKKGLLEMALRYYQAAAVADPKAVEPRLRIASTQHALGQACEALDALRAARELVTDDERRGALLGLLPKIEADCDRERRPAKPRGRSR